MMLIGRIVLRRARTRIRRISLISPISTRRRGELNPSTVVTSRAVSPAGSRHERRRYRARWNELFLDQVDAQIHSLESMRAEENHIAGLREDHDSSGQDPCNVENGKTD